jgi:hypothetical protein
VGSAIKNYDVCASVTVIPTVVMFLTLIPNPNLQSCPGRQTFPLLSFIAPVGVVFSHHHGSLSYCIMCPLPFIETKKQDGLEQKWMSAEAGRD